MFVKFFLVPPRRHSVIVYVGPWACRYAWDRSGRFGNGLRWSSGWHRWREDDLYD